MADPQAALEAIGLLPDIEIDPAIAALQLARLDGTAGDWQPAASHLSELARESAAIGAVLSDRPAEARIGALAGLIHAHFGYRGDRDSYDHLDNANLIHVVRRRRGLPVALGILWLHCIRAAGWEGSGIDFPGHFLVALATDRDDAATPVSATLIDAFSGGRVVTAPDLLALLRTITGRDTPIAPGMVRPMSTRDVLLRLQRNLVRRRTLAEDLGGALTILGGMLLIAPDTAANWLEAADLHRRLGETDRSIACLERFLVLVPWSDASRRARTQLEALRRQP